MVPSYRFAITPRWIAGHLLALVAIVSFVMFGFWQLRRLDERRELNATIATAMEAAPVDADALRGDDPESLEYRRIVLTGTYRTSEEVLLRARSYNGSPGNHLLTPLELADGTAVIVDRGWIPLDAGDPPVAVAEPPVGDVMVEGIVRLTQRRGSFGPVDPPEGELSTISRVDLDRLARQIDGPLASVFVELHRQDPPQPVRFPIPLEDPVLSEGPHLGYAVQWFAFAAVTLIGYPLLLRRTARRRTGLTPSAAPSRPSSSP